MILADDVKPALFAIDLNISHHDLWLLSDRSIVWDTYQHAIKTEGNSNFSSFFQHANETIKERIDRARVTKFNPTSTGRWLSFDPQNALFEDVAQDITKGFFGAGDCPPPALWTHTTGNVLFSFIPQKYIDVATVGVDVCVNNTLSWEEM